MAWPFKPRSSLTVKEATGSKWTGEVAHPVIADCPPGAAPKPVDAQQVGRVAREHRSQLLAVARRFFSCESDCADAVQDAFVAALQYLPTFRGTCKLETWLHRIVVNACLMKLRTHRRRQAATLDEDAAIPAALADEHPLWGEEQRNAVRRALQALPERQRTIIQLRFFEGFNTAETAELLGINSSAVKTRLHRSCRALRRILKSANEWDGAESSECRTWTLPVECRRIR